MKYSEGKTEYLIGEIFLPVRMANEELKTKELAEKLLQEMSQKNVPFEVVAAQFSQAPGAQQSGGLGWVQEGQLPDELEDAMKALQPGKMSKPIRGLSGFHILTLKDTRTASIDTMPDEETILNSIGLERLDRLQKRYLADIRSAAFIERRE